MLIVDRDEGMLYEFKKGEPAFGMVRGMPSQVSHLIVRVMPCVPKDTQQQMHQGLPILPGLVRYDEVSSGAINHALRVSVPATNHSYVWPARVKGNDGNTDGTYPPWDSDSG